MAKKEKKTTEASAAEAEVRKTKKSAKKAVSDGKPDTKQSAKKTVPDSNPGKKKKQYTVEEILAAGDSVLKTGANGKQQKIKVRTKSKLKARQARWGYFFTFPWVVGAAIFLVYPLYTAIRWAFVYRRDLGRYGIKETFYGIQNFRDVLNQNTSLWGDLGTFLAKMVVAVPMIVVFALLMALLLNTSIKGKGLYRTIFFLPVVIVSGPTMSMMMSSSEDVISAVDLTAVSSMVEGVLPGFLATAVTYVFENIILFLWYSGVQILIFISALQKIDTALYEAAKIDGGSTWECFWKITLPTIRPFILLNAIYTVVSLSQDENINTLITSIKSSMTAASQGYTFASAFALMYTAVVLILIGIVALLLVPKKDIYEKQIVKNRRMEKRTRRAMARTERRVARNSKKFAKMDAKRAAMKAKGKIKEDDTKGGKFDD